jgi:phosphoglycolate phosphatase
MIDFEKIESKYIIFDLDGTLIDSADAILESFKWAFSVCGCKPKIPYSKSLIGPPLMEILVCLSGVTDKTTLNALADAFKKYYDEYGYSKTKAFDQIPIALETLHQLGHSLFVATNKRIIPTIKIIDHLNWNNYFTAVLALDGYKPILSNKAELLNRLMVDYKIQTGDAIYIGDRNEDAEAASVNGLNFMMVEWGYKN